MSFLTDPPPLPRCHTCWHTTQCCTCAVSFRGELISRPSRYPVTQSELDRAAGGSSQQAFARYVNDNIERLESYANHPVNGGD